MNRSTHVGFPVLDDPRPSVRATARVAVALFLAVCALGVGWRLEPLVLRPYFFPASVAFIVTALLAGTRYGILTSAIFAGGHAFLHAPPRGSFSLGDSREVLAVVGFFVTGAVVSVLGGLLRRSHLRLHREHQLLVAAQSQREDLLRALAHDIASPLGIITTNAAAIRRSTSADDGESVRRRSESIEAAAHSVASMLGDLVDAATLESGHVRLELAALEVAAFVRDLTERLAGTLPIQRVHILIAPDLPRVHVDPHRFERILVNLLTNALKYSPAESPVTMGAARRGRSVELTVTDHGPGITPEDLSRIFEKYYRTTDARSEAGLGLGLFITRLLVEAHGGRIWAESRLGSGTTFHVELPGYGSPTMW